MTENEQRTQYYYREMQDREWLRPRYLGRKERDFAGRLAQRDYDQLVLKSADEELAFLDKMLQKYPKAPDIIWGRIW